MENRFGTFGDNDSAKGLLFNQRISEIGNELIEEHNNHIANTNIHVTAEKQAAWDNLKTFQTAGGTGTAITLTGIELVDGFQTTFVVKTSNSGAATTINGKPLYKPGTTTSPKLIAGKAATVWYNSAGDCFFYKASAEGTATAGDVLAGKTFSNDDDTGLVGTFSNIKSIQRGSTLNTAASIDIAISSVDLAKSVVVLSSITGGTYIAGNLVGGQLTSATNLNILINTSVTKTVYWTVIEFENVKSLQKGIVTTTGVSDYPITINTVNVEKSLVFVSYTTTNTSNNTITYKSVGEDLTNATTLTLRSYHPQPRTAYWQVIEFN